MRELAHESAILHVTGKAIYIDDMPLPANSLYGHVVYSKVANGTILGYNIEKAKKLPGIQAILSWEDIPGENQMGPVVHDQPALAGHHVTSIGQAIFLIAADDEETALAAEKLIEIKMEESEPILTIEDAVKKGSLLQPPRKIACGDVDKSLEESEFTISGTLKTGAQEHWYLETQVCVCIPGESGQMTAYSSTQNPAETQAIIAEVLGVPKNQVEVITRRMGGGFGGKETEGNHIAAWTALLANATKRPVKIRLSRDDDQIMTGKRHPFLTHYKVGFNKQGLINAIDVELNSNGGNATDLSMAILERAMLHAENAYYIPNMRIIGKAWKTNLPSNTAFRGFGGPQGMAVMETIIDRIGRFLGIDPLEVRLKNFYGTDKCNVAPYGEIVENNKLFQIYDKINETGLYQKKRKEIEEFNRLNTCYKKGLALTPVKFGISFTTSFLNQAGALVNIYKDGTVLVNQGGTEMGQGLYTKIQQIAAKELGIDTGHILVNATDTSKVPNTSPTAASSGCDLNGMAVKNATDKLKERISNIVAAEMTKNHPQKPTLPENIGFSNNQVFDKQNPERIMDFKSAVMLSYLKQVSLSATGYYATPGIYFDRNSGQGRPFHYYAFGMAMSEVLVDCLTGNTRILFSKILHDTGKSVNPGIDIGQVEGGYIQGMGWVTSEECRYDSKGNLLNHSPDTYKIPTIDDIPAEFIVDLLPEAPNPDTIHNSKAVGEPPFMLAFSVWLAIKDAISAVGNHQYEPDFEIPATHEHIVFAIENIKNKMQS